MRFGPFDAGHCHHAIRGAPRPKDGRQRRTANCSRLASSVDCHPVSLAAIAGVGTAVLDPSRIGNRFLIQASDPDYPGAGGGGSSTNGMDSVAFRFDAPDTVAELFNHPGYGFQETTGETELTPASTASPHGGCARAIDVRRRGRPRQAAPSSNWSWNHPRGTSVTRQFLKWGARRAGTPDQSEIRRKRSCDLERYGRIARRATTAPVTASTSSSSPSAPSRRSLLT
jgi:hypothetical protein